MNSQHQFLNSLSLLRQYINYKFLCSGGGCENGPSASGPSYINTFQRGPEESVWRTIPQPTCDSFKYGGTNGFLDLFVGMYTINKSVPAKT